jgi:hypothetical protein
MGSNTQGPDYDWCANLTVAAGSFTGLEGKTVTQTVVDAKKVSIKSWLEGTVLSLVCLLLVCHAAHKSQYMVTDRKTFVAGQASFEFGFFGLEGGDDRGGAMFPDWPIRVREGNTDDVPGFKGRHTPACPLRNAIR